MKKKTLWCIIDAQINFNANNINFLDSSRLIIGINVYHLSMGYVDWIIHSSLPKVSNVFIDIIVFPFKVVYIGTILDIPKRYCHNMILISIHISLCVCVYIYVHI